MYLLFVKILVHAFHGNQDLYLPLILVGMVEDWILGWSIPGPGELSQSLVYLKQEVSLYLNVMKPVLSFTRKLACPQYKCLNYLFEKRKTKLLLKVKLERLFCFF